MNIFPYPKTTKIWSWILVVAVLCGMLLSITAPAFSDSEKPFVVKDGQIITETILEDSAKLRFETCFENEDETEKKAYQWQIKEPGSSDSWINISGGYSKHLWVTYALVGSMLEDNGSAYLRCQVKFGETEVYTDAVRVTVSKFVEGENAAPSKSAQNTMLKSSRPLMRAAKATDEEEYKVYSIVINYLFDDNSIAFEPYGATIAAGDSFKPTDPIKSPDIVGYKPFRRVGNEYVDATYVDFDIESVNENITINVIYEPTLVNYSVHPYLQNVLDDEYTLNEDLIETKQALTGSMVGDGLALTEEQLPGFKSLDYERLIVAADGSTVIDIRYDRNYYLVKFELSGGYGTEPVYTRYGSTVRANTPTRHGYVFDGWELVSYNGQTPTNEQKSKYALSIGGSIEVPAASLTYKARWNTQQTTYTMVFWRENENDSGYTYWGYLDGLPAMSGSTVSAQDYIGRVSGIDDEQHFTFNKSKSDKNVLVEGDGSTVVNVYYTRNYYKITFKAKGNCTIPENHTHTDSCYDTICGLGHTHTSDCVSELICTVDEHKAHTAECLSCELEEHIHGSVNCDCTITEHKHVKDCYRNVGSRQGSISGAPVNPKDGYIYRSGTWYAQYYIYISGEWYQYQGWGASTGDIVDPSCGQTAHTHGTDCACSKTPHTHSESCYSDTLHTHTETCYKYSCGAIEHTHTADCQRLKCGIPEGHKHSSDSGTNKTVKIVYAKYRQSLKNIWPVTDDNKVTYDDGQRWDPSESSIYDEVLVYIDEMPGESFTLTVNTSSYSTYTMNYYLQVLDGEEGDVEHDGKYYKRYTQIKANYGRVTKAEDFFNIRGFYQYDSNPNFSGDSITINSGSKVVDFYYNRIVDHKLTFSNNGIVLTDKTVSGVMYGDGVEEYNFEPDYPSNLEPNAYTFKGWYTSPGCFDGTEVNWSTLTMPEGDLLLYAKWAPVTHTVRVFKDKSKTQQIGETQIVNHGEVASQPSGDVSNGNYTFLGWFYEDVVNGETVEKAFVFNGIPILKDIDIYARWGSHFSVTYTIYYKLESGQQIADPTVGSAIVGNNKTFNAKTDTDLYEGFRTGYYPNTSSHTVTMSAEGDYVYTFYYKFVESMPYKVQYLTVDGEPVFGEDSYKYVWDNNLSVVTETFKKAEKMMPDAYQKRLVLSSKDTDADGDGVYDANVITFYYKTDEVHAYYRAVHYLQNIRGNTYREYYSEDRVGVIGEKCTINAMNLTGFACNGDKTTVKVNGVVMSGSGTSIETTLTEDGVLVEFYYDRQSFEYVVRYIDRQTNKEIIDKKRSSAPFGEQIVETAANLEGMGYNLVSENSKLHTISANIEMNVIDFYYQEKNVTLKYQIVGPENCGSLSMGSENMTAISGIPTGSEPSVRSGFIFLGWYTDADCKTPVDASWVDSETNLLKPQKSGDVWWDATYYAKFAALETDLTIKTESTSPIDENQVFIFNIMGKENTETENVNLTVTVVGNGSVTITKLPVGQYTVTELNDWSWRYENSDAQREINLGYNNGSNEIVFDNNRESGKWLDGNAVKDNKF